MLSIHTRYGALTFWLSLTALIAGCDGSEGGAADGGLAGACSQSALIAQCPPGSNPALGISAQQQCEGAVGGIVSDARGAATGSCAGSASCQVYCQFASPCLCGVAEVSRESVRCMPCNEEVGCGNGICEGGEDPDTCPIDCGARCNPGDQRCQGEGIEECNLQGRWEHIPCGREMVCEVRDGQALCVRGDILRGDAGIGEDAGPPQHEIIDGRILLGPGQWPEGGLGDVSRPGAGHTFEVHPQHVTHTFADLNGTERPLRSVSQLLWRDDHSLRAYGLAAHADVDLLHWPQLEASPAQPYPEALGGLLYQAYAIRSTADGRYVFLHSRDTTPQWHRLDTQSGELRSTRFSGDLTITRPGEAPRREDFALAATGRAILFTARQGETASIVHWDFEAEEGRILLSGEGEWRNATFGPLALSPDGRVAALSMLTIYPTMPLELRGVSLWNVAQGQRIYTILHPAEGSTESAPYTQIAPSFGGGVHFTPDGQQLVAAVVEGTYSSAAAIELWQLDTHQRTQMLPLEIPPGDSLAGHAVHDLTLSPDGRTLALFYQTGSRPTPHLDFWDTTTGRLLKRIEPPHEQVFDMSTLQLRYAPDGQHLLFWATPRGTGVPNQPTLAEHLYLYGTDAWESP